MVLQHGKCAMQNASICTALVCSVLLAGGSVNRAHRVTSSAAAMQMHSWH